MRDGQHGSGTQRGAMHFDEDALHVDAKRWAARRSVADHPRACSRDHGVATGAHGLLSEAQAQGPDSRIMKLIGGRSGPYCQLPCPDFSQLRAPKFPFHPTSKPSFARCSKRSLQLGIEGLVRLNEQAYIDC